MKGPTETVSLALETVEGTGLRFAGKTGPYTVLLDSGRSATAPNPVRTMLLCLGACTAMDVISILRKKRQVVTAYEVAMTGERRGEHPRSFETIEIVHRLHGRDLSPAAIEEAIRLSATKYCSITGQISATAKITNRFEILDP